MWREQEWTDILLLSCCVHSNSHYVSRNGGSNKLCRSLSSFFDRDSADGGTSSICRNWEFTQLVQRRIDTHSCWMFFLVCVYFCGKGVSYCFLREQEQVNFFQINAIANLCSTAKGSRRGSCLSGKIEGVDGTIIVVASLKFLLGD